MLTDLLGLNCLVEEDHQQSKWILVQGSEKPPADDDGELTSPV